MKIELTTPAPYLSLNPNTIIDLKALSEWKANLPTDNPVSCAEKLLDAVKLLNRHPRKVLHRYELMEIHLLPYIDLIKWIRKLSQLRGHTERHRNEAYLTRVMEELSHEMGFGFKRCVLDALKPGLARVDSGKLNKMIYWASQCLTFDLMFAFADYRPEPRNTWREFLTLYLLSRRRKISGFHLADPCAMDGVSPSVDLAFRRAMLILILDPYKLRRGDVWNAYDYLSYFALKAVVTTFRVPDVVGGNFLVDMKGERKPQPLRPDRLPERPRDFLLLNVNALNAVVHRHFKMLEINPDVEIEGLHNLDGSRAMHLFRTMLINWHLSPDRRHERIEEYDWLMVICGLPDICLYLLEEGEGVDTVAEEEVKVVKLQDQLLKSEERRKTYRWRQVDFSANGVGAVIPMAEAVALQVGQLVLIESEGDRGAQRRHVGVVRRLVKKDANNMEAGMQFLPGKIISTHIHHRDKPIAVLVVERNEGRNRTLITPAGVHRQGRIIEVKTGKKTAYTVTAGKLLETSGCIERFEVQRR